MISKNKYKVIGLMSGTSLDGLDIAYCIFNKKSSGWNYAIEQAETLPYNTAWTAKLTEAQLLLGDELLALDAEYGRWLGKVTAEFMKRHTVKADFIASHGHTIFHQPARQFTYQLGNGQALHAGCGIPVIYDFRTLDVLLGGQGAPLVPIGDKLLFHQYDVCLNLGGIANLSMEIKRKRVAFDVCFMNMGLNHLMSTIQKKYDNRGELSATGSLNMILWKALGKEYHLLRKKRPSLSREIFEERFRPLLNNDSIPLADRLYTFTECAAAEIASTILAHTETGKVLCTGGGTLNAYFISRLLELVGDHVQLIIPETDVIKYKEALVFAFLGVLKVRGENNCLHSVTGALRDSSSGLIVGLR